MFLPPRSSISLASQGFRCHSGPEALAGQGRLHCLAVSTVSGGGARHDQRRLQVLLVEDDAGDALLVQEFLQAHGPEGFDVLWTRRLEEATAACADKGSVIDCVLLDLGLPDATGIDGLGAILAACPDVAVVVLTGLSERLLAIRAVAAGAQDYLIKDEVNPAILDRTLRLAVERRVAERAAVALVESSLRQRHNEQVVRGLLPKLRVDDEDLTMVTRYLPGNAGEVLGGDFLDAVQLEDGTIRAVIGDVAGHGPGEAAIGVNLRIAWRALTLAGTNPTHTFRRLNDQLINDTGVDELFATVVAVTIAPDRRRLTAQIAGHPPPMLVDGESVRELDVAHGTVVGFGVDVVPPEVDVDLGAPWRLLLYTDGLVEGRDGEARERWGSDGLLEFLTHHATDPPEDIADTLIEEAARRHGGPLPDDVAILVIAYDG